MPHALITGAAGFIGGHLVDSLLAQGWQITGLDNFDPFYSPLAKRQNIKPHLAHTKYQLVQADISNIDECQSKLAGKFDVIVHLAAKAGVRPSIFNPLVYQQVNVTGTQNLLELARRWGTPQFVFASSSSVYGINPNVPWSEDDNVLLPISPYASTKLSCEFLGHVYSQLFGIRFLALRFFTVYGPRQRPDLAIHKFAAQIKAGNPITVYGDGSTMRDYTYVSDITAGIRQAMIYSNSQYEVINLGNNRPVKLLDLIGQIGHALQTQPNLHFADTQPGDVPQTWANIDKAQRLLNYRPDTPLSVGIANFATWFASCPMALPAVPSPALRICG